MTRGAFLHFWESLGGGFQSLLRPLGAFGFVLPTFFPPCPFNFWHGPFLIMLASSSFPFLAGSTLLLAGAVLLVAGTPLLLARAVVLLLVAGAVLLLGGTVIILLAGTVLLLAGAVLLLAGAVLLFAGAVSPRPHRRPDQFDQLRQTP